ncbi:MAG: response regulator transcription factor [Oculatellaceae cyanobacterium bins.114]|nr:response regulator transcription factor [Oculatellaceae cyanobacterium bins.114]
MPHPKLVPELSRLTIDSLKIIIVDADLRSQFELKQRLSSYPQLNIVSSVTNGQASFSAAKLLKPDLIILNTQLPDLNSIVVLKTLKALLPQVRVMMLSSDRNERRVTDALLHGADAYCLKSISPAQLLVAIACVQDGAIYLDPHIARCVVNQLEKPTSDQPIANLTKRELEILHLIVKGQTNNEIGKTLYLSPYTIKCHVRNIMNKLAVDDRVQIAVRALRSGLVKSHVA